MRPACNQFLRQRRTPVRSRPIYARHPFVHAGCLGSASPDLIAGNGLVKAHDLAPPAFACVRRWLATLLQALMDHFVEKGVVVSDEMIMILRQVETDQPASSFWTANTVGKSFAVG